MGVAGATGRSVQFRKRERSAQFEAARPLSLRDGDGGQEGVLGRRGADGVALQQELAARPMQLRFERAIADAVGRRQRLVEDRDGAAWIARAGLSLSQRDLQEPVENQDVLFAKLLDAAAHVQEVGADRAALSGRPALEKYAEGAKQGQVMLACEPGEFESIRRGAGLVATHQFEQGRVHSSKRERADMGEVRDPRLHAVDERNRAIDLAERP